MDIVTSAFPRGTGKGTAHLTSDDISRSRQGAPVRPEKCDGTRFYLANVSRQRALPRGDAQVAFERKPVNQGLFFQSAGISFGFVKPGGRETDSRRPNSSIPDHQAFHHRSHWRTGNRIHQFVSLHVRFGGGHFAADDRWLRPTTACSRRIQSLAELSYEFVAGMIQSRIGPEGMKFFPLIFSLFMFICISNLIGLIPYAFTVSSHIIVTAALALLVFFIVLFYGLYKNGLKFFKLFVPSGVPIGVLPLVVLIEIMAFFFVKPVSHSLRLFANMLAGHIALKVFASFVGMLGTLGLIGWIGAIFPLGLTIALTALELLIAFLQAYVFAVLACIYLNDAVHPGH
jgi:F-type H+-transporting ATPase subunit a